MRENIPNMTVNIITVLFPHQRQNGYYIFGHNGNDMVGGNKNKPNVQVQYKHCCVNLSLCLLGWCGCHFLYPRYYCLSFPTQYLGASTRAYLFVGDLLPDLALRADAARGNPGATTTAACLQACCTVCLPEIRRRCCLGRRCGAHVLPQGGCGHRRAESLDVLLVLVLVGEDEAVQREARPHGRCPTRHARCCAHHGHDTVV